MFTAVVSTVLTNEARLERAADATNALSHAVHIAAQTVIRDNVASDRRRLSMIYSLRLLGIIG